MRLPSSSGVPRTVGGTAQSCSEFVEGARCSPGLRRAATCVAQSSDPARSTMDAQASSVRATMDLTVRPHHRDAT